MNVDDVVAEKIAAARARAEATKRRRAALAANRQRGLALRHAAKLRNQASRGDTPTTDDLRSPDGHAGVGQPPTTAGQSPKVQPNRGDMTTVADPEGVSVVHTRVHVYVEFANPFLVCDLCRKPVPRWHNNDKCGCDATFWNMPCEHTAGITSVCPSWSPVDGCTCKEVLGSVDHDPAPVPEVQQ